MINAQWLMFTEPGAILGGGCVGRETAFPSKKWFNKI